LCNRWREDSVRERWKRRLMRDSSMASPTTTATPNTSIWNIRRQARRSNRHFHSHSLCRAITKLLCISRSQFHSLLRSNCGNTHRPLRLLPIFQSIVLQGGRTVTSNQANMIQIWLQVSISLAVCVACWQSSYSVVFSRCRISKYGCIVWQRSRERTPNMERVWTPRATSGKLSLFTMFYNDIDWRPLGYPKEVVL
jgi:hypothetical protein